MEFGVGEDLRAGGKADGGAGFLGVLDRGKRGIRHTHGIGLGPELAVAADGHLQAAGQGIHHRHPYPVQTTGYLVGIVVELTAGVQHGHDDLGCRAFFFLVLVHGNTAAVVGHRYRTIGMDGDLDAVGVTRQGLVHRVVHHFEHNVVQTGAIIGIADVHARPLSDRIKALENLDVLRVVSRHRLGILQDRCAPVGFGHRSSLWKGPIITVSAPFLQGFQAGSTWPRFT